MCLQICMHKMWGIKQAIHFSYSYIERVPTIASSSSTSAVTKRPLGVNPTMCKAKSCSNTCKYGCISNAKRSIPLLWLRSPNQYPGRFFSMSPWWMTADVLLLNQWQQTSHVLLRSKLYCQVVLSSYTLLPVRPKNQPNK